MSEESDKRLTTEDHSKASATPPGTKGDVVFMEAQPDFHFYSWSPDPPGTADAKSTQVHMHIQLAPGAVIVVRFKSAVAADAHIEAMRRHREDVWGKP